MSQAIADQLFLAYMGRAADTQWRSNTTNVVTAQGGNPSVALQQAFYKVAVAEGVFSATDSPSVLVNKIFLQTFGFAASTFEQTAWGNLISNGTMSAETAAWTIFASYLGATNVPAAYQLPVQSKLVAMNAFSNALTDATINAAYSQTNSASATAGRTWLSAVTSQATAGTAITGVAATVAGLSVSNGSAFTLTTATDSGAAFTGTAGNDTYTALNTTLTTADNLNGGLGTDTLNVTMAAAAAPLVTLASIENVNITTAVATLGANINATNWSGVEKVAVIGMGVSFSDSVANGTTGNSITNLQNNVIISLTNAKTADNDAAIFVNFDAAKVTAGSTLTLDLNGVTGTTASTGRTDIIVDVSGVGTVDATRFTKLAVTGSGTNVVRVGDNGSAFDNAEIVLTSITVAGSGSNNILVDGTDVTVASVATVNASTATGALTLDISASTKDVTFTGSAGKNTITFGNGANTITGGAAIDTFTLGSGINTVTGNAGNDIVITALADLLGTDVIALGEGTRDEIRYNNVTTLNAAGVDATALTNLNKQTGVEVVGSSGAVTAIDAGYFTQTVFNMTGALTAAVTATNVASDTLSFTSGITGVNGDALTVSGALPNQTITLELGGSAGVTITATDAAGSAGNNGLVVSTGISTVNIVSSTTATTGTITNSIGLAAATVGTHSIDNASAGSFVLTGATNFTIITGATAGFTQAVDFNATAFTGKLAIAGSASADVIKGGSGADTINAHDGDDIMTGGAGADTFVVISGHLSGAPSATVFETITDYAKGSDIIDWDATVTFDAAAADAVATVAKVSGTTGIATFHAEDDTLAERIVAATKGMDADGDFVVFEHGTDTYVYISGDGNATQDAADTLIKLTGVTGITTSTINADNNLVLA